MANLFRNLFGHKKSHSKGDDANGNEQMNMERDTSRRSTRPSSSSQSRSALRGARFQDDSMLPPTAAYHTQNQTTRVRRGPKSCPPEYVDEEPASSRSFNVDSFRREPRDQRRQSSRMVPSSSMMTSSSSSHRNPYQQRWETSEYGSENTSPIGYHRHQQQHHRRHQEEEDDEEEDDETEEETYSKKSRYQELKRKLRAHYEEKLFNYERTQRSDNRQIKELEKEKDELVKMLLQSNAKLDKERKKTEYFKRKWQEAEQQIKVQPAFGQFGFQVNPPQFPQMYQFGGGAGGSGHNGGVGQRYSFMGAPMHPISSSNTPTTSAMDTTAGGAGESLVPASDVSFMAPLTTVPSALPPLDISNNSGPSTSSAQPNASNFFPDDDEEDQDEIKNFRDEDIEAPRGSRSTLKNEELIDSPEFMDKSFLLPLEEGKDSGFSTTPDDENKAEKAQPVH